MTMRSHLLTLILLITASTLLAEDAPRFRTDADGPVTADQAKKVKGKGKSGPPEWYQLVAGKFPPQGSAHAVSGELIQVDHLERRFHLRVDRNDSQDRGVWDLPVDAVMLPYGSIYYHGAPAALEDIPLGTHLHGLFYLRDPGDKSPPPPADYNRKTPEVDFRRCFQIEDDFSFRARQKQLWTIDSVDLTAKKLVATLNGAGAALGKPQTFDLTTGTRVLQGNGFGELELIKPGQSVLFNLTWCTLYGPGRIVDIWLDEPSRQTATAQQLKRHRNHVREHGLPGWVDAVDDEQQIVTITFFGNVDPELFGELSLASAEPPAKPEDKPKPRGAIAVARESLMTYDPVNDRKAGNVLDIKKVPVEPGSGGVCIRVQCDMLLEGFRPRRIVRFYPPAWKVVALPREEQYFGRE
jgi:hypothetical protein